MSCDEARRSPQTGALIADRPGHCDRSGSHGRTSTRPRSCAGASSRSGRVSIWFQRTSRHRECGSNGTWRDLYAPSSNAVNDYRRRGPARVARRAPAGGARTVSGMLGKTRRTRQGPAGHSGRAINFLSRRDNGIFPGTAGKKRLTALPPHPALSPETAVPDRWGESASRAEKSRGRGNFGAKSYNAHLSRKAGRKVASTTS